MDTLDKASEMETAYRENMIKAVRDVDKTMSSRVCLDCGEPIPEQRRLAVKGCCRCVDCQIVAETRLGLGVRG